MVKADLTDANLTNPEARPPNYKYYPKVRLSASLQMVQIFQQQIEERLHSDESLEAHGVNEPFPALQLLQRPRHRRLRPLLPAVPLGPLIEVCRQRGDFELDLGDPVQAVRYQAVVTLQDHHYGGRSFQRISGWVGWQTDRNLQESKHMNQLVKHSFCKEWEILCHHEEHHKYVTWKSLFSLTTSCSAIHFTFVFIFTTSAGTGAGAAVLTLRSCRRENRRARV